jgi:hypothetical protein
MVEPVTFDIKWCAAGCYSINELEMYQIKWTTDTEMRKGKKDKFFLCLMLWSCMGQFKYSPIVPNLGTRWRWVDSFIPQLFYTWGNSLCNQEARWPPQPIWQPECYGVWPLQGIEWNGNKYSKKVLAIPYSLQFTLSLAPDILTFWWLYVKSR